MSTHIQSNEPTPEAGQDQSKSKRFHGYPRLVINIKMSERPALRYLEASEDGATLGDFTVTALSYRKGQLEESLERPQTPLFAAEILEDKWVQDPKYGRM